MYHHRSHLCTHHVYPWIRITQHKYHLRYQDHYIQSNYPTDSDSIACGYGVNTNYPFVYFPNITNINEVTVRLCRESAWLFAHLPAILSSYADPIRSSPPAPSMESIQPQSSTPGWEVSACPPMPQPKLQSTKQPISKITGISSTSSTVFASVY